MQTAFVLCNCELGSKAEVLLKLETIPDVTEICGTFGAYDIVATVKASSEEDLRKTITGDIRGIPKIRSTLTLTVTK